MGGRPFTSISDPVGIADHILDPSELSMVEYDIDANSKPDVTTEEAQERSLLNPSRPSWPPAITLTVLAVEKVVKGEN